MGVVSAHFSHYCFRPYFFDPIFCPSKNEDPKIVAERSKKAAIYSWAIYLLVFIKIVILYSYVDRN